MDLNNRPVLYGGAIAIVLVVALFLVAPIYGVLGLAVVLLGALVIANRVRVMTEEDDEFEESNLDATERLGALFDDEQPTMLDDRGDDFPQRRGVLFEDEAEQFEEYREPAAEWVAEPTPAEPVAEEWAPEPAEGVTQWTTDELDSSSTFAPEDYVPESPEVFNQPAEQEAATVDWSPDAFEAAPAATDYAEPEPLYEVPIDTGTPDFAARAAEFERVLEDVSLDDVDATAVLADEGNIDEAKVTDDTAILAASQASRVGADTMTEEEGNEETKEILGRVAALLAKYE